MNYHPKHARKAAGKDRLSDLHDDILIIIQSFLDVKSAAQTCVLSKRWNNKLWIHHPDVYLSSKTFGKTSNNFGKFVDMVFKQRDKLHLKIRSFSFTWSFESKIPKHLFDKVHAYAQNHDVRHFDLSMCYRHHSYFSQNFNPKSLTTLRLNLMNLNGGTICSDHNVRSHILHLYLRRCTALKTLCLEKFRFQIDSGHVDLFSGLVDLTELHIIGCQVTGRFLIGAPRLERLTILNNNYGPHWNISSRVLKYLRTDLRLMKRTRDQLPRFIEELEIDFQSIRNHETADHANWLINQIRCLPHAKSVTLSKATLQVMSAFPQIFDSKVPVTLPQFKWEFLKVITTHELPTNEFPEYRPGLAALTKNCSKTLKVEFV